MTTSHRRPTPLRAALLFLLCPLSQLAPLQATPRLDHKESSEADALKKNERNSPEIPDIRILNIQTFGNQKGEEWQEANALILNIQKTSNHLKKRDTTHQN